jgi:capsular polysaccharide biosynthesis protein
MEKIVRVRPPLNLSAEDNYLFEPFVTYSLSSLSVKKYKNVVVSYTGFCWDQNDVLIKESHHDYPAQYEDYLQEVTWFQLDIFRNPENLIRLGPGKAYLQIHHPWFNYYHWMCEPILRQWMIKDRSRDLILLLPDYYGKVDYIMSSLEPFEFKDIFFIPATKCVLVEDLWMPAIKPIADSYHEREIREIRQFYLNYVQRVKGITIDRGERIYISRQKSSRRRVTNEEELQHLLEGYGFSIVYNEDYTFFEQVALYSNAKYLVSIHGAGMTNMLFMKANSTILELHKRKTNEKDWHSLAFWYMAECLGHDYYHQVCLPADPSASFYDADFIVDIGLVNKNLELIFGKRENQQR